MINVKNNIKENIRCSYGDDYQLEVLSIIIKTNIKLVMTETLHILNIQLVMNETSHILDIDKARAH